MTFLRTINIVLMIVAPFLVSLFFINRFKSSWKIWWIGGLIFVVSQLGHIPFNYFAGKLLNQTSLVSLPQNSIIIFNAIFLGLSAGLWEESSRYLGYKYWLKKPESWRKGIVIGLGHGSIEAIILGIIAFYVLIQMIAVRGADLSTLVPIENLSQTYQAVRNYWSVNWYDTFLPFIERGATIPIHVALTILVIQTFKRKSFIWFWLAIIFHALVDASVVLLISYTNIYYSELAVAFFAVLSIMIIFLLKDKTISFDWMSKSIPQETKRITSKEIFLDDSLEKLDDSKYL